MTLYFKIIVILDFLISWFMNRETYPEHHRILDIPRLQICCSWALRSRQIHVHNSPYHEDRYWPRSCQTRRVSSEFPIDWPRDKELKLKNVLYRGANNSKKILVIFFKKIFKIWEKISKNVKNLGKLLEKYLKKIP